MNEDIEKQHSTVEDKIAELEMQGFKVNEVDDSDYIPTGWRQTKVVEGEKVSYGQKRSTICEDDTSTLYMIEPFGGANKETEYYLWRHGEFEEPFQSKEKSKEIKDKLYKAVNETLKPLGFKRHHSKKSAWWRLKGGQIEGVFFYRFNSNHSYRVNLSRHNTSDIKDVDTNMFEINTNTMSHSFNGDGEYKLIKLLDFSDIPTEDMGESPEDNKISEFTKILEKFIPLHFDKPEEINKGRIEISELLNNHSTT